MKTLNTTIQESRHTPTATRQQFLPVVMINMRSALALLSAVAAATAIVILSVWLAGTDMSNIVGASTWGLGFIFLGLAVDNREPANILQWISGIALLSLAGLQNFVSADFAIGSGVIVASWVAIFMFRYIR